MVDQTLSLTDRRNYGNGKAAPNVKSKRFDPLNVLPAQREAKVDGMNLKGKMRLREATTMSDLQLEAVPLPASPDIPDDAPAIPSFFDTLHEPESGDVTRPMVEPLDTFLPRLKRVARIP